MSLAQLILLAWIPLVIYLFVLLPPRRAVLFAFIVGWLFLPVHVAGEPLSAKIALKGIPSLDKSTVTSLCVLLGLLIFDSKRLLSFRFHWMDIPVLVLVLCPIASSINNHGPDAPQLGLYDGMSEAFAQFIVWGLPYLIGRVYFSDPAGLRELAIAVVIGGFAYLPVCWWEFRMSPQLHANLYGYHPATFGMQKRYEGFRPMGFLPGGLSLGMWMTVSALTAFWLWKSKLLRKFEGLPFGWLVAPLFLTALVSKATLAMLLLASGAAILLITRYFRTALPLTALMLCIVLYIVTRSSSTWSGDVAVQAVTAVFGEKRAQSIEYRLGMENILTEKAMQRPWLGWAGWSRSRVTDEEGNDISVTDGLWIVTLGKFGFVGLAGLTLTLLLPAINLMRYVPARRWHEPQFAIPAVAVVCLVLHMTDNLLNGFPNPVFMMMCGGVTGLLSLGRRAMLSLPSPSATPAAAAASVDISPPRPGPREPTTTGSTPQRGRRELLPLHPKQPTWQGDKP